MQTIEINDVGKIGAIADTPSYMLPPEAWTRALNMRSQDGGMESLGGWAQIFGTPGVAPHFAIPIRTVSATFWLYVSLTKGYGYDGTTHTDITRASGGDYAAGETRNWNGTILGGIPIVNNGVDVPQIWPTISLATKLTNLTNWPSTLRAKVVRAFGPFLIAIGCTKSGVAFPHMVKWSHPAVPGSVPSSWDETDPTKDTGELDLPDVNAGLLTEAMTLGDILFLYKDTSIWKMRYVGGQSIMDVGKGPWQPTLGVLAPRCVVSTSDGSRHVVATQDDIIWHNGNTVKSILAERQRRRLFREIDPANYVNSFMFDNPTFSEVWFCYPTEGVTNPNKALIMKYNAGDIWPITEADGITFRNATVGSVEVTDARTWETATDGWDVDSTLWSNVRRRRVVLSAPDSTKFFDLDSGTTRDGVAFTSSLYREALAVLGQKRNGEWIVDYQKMKLVDDLWPKIVGDGVSVRLGAQQTVNGAVTWGPTQTFNSSSGIVSYGGPVSGRATAIEFWSTNFWRLDGYKYGVTPLGDF